MHVCMYFYVCVSMYMYIYIYIFIPMCVCISIYPSIHCSTGSVSVGVQCPFTSSLYEFPVGLNRYWVRLLGSAENQVLGNTRYSVIKSLPWVMLMGRLVLRLTMLKTCLKREGSLRLTSLLALVLVMK